LLLIMRWIITFGLWSAVTRSYCSWQSIKPAGWRTSPRKGLLIKDLRRARTEMVAKMATVNQDDGGQRGVTGNSRAGDCDLGIACQQNADQAER
jgi:hypothetical protein